MQFSELTKTQWEKKHTQKKKKKDLLPAKLISLKETNLFSSSFNIP